MSSFIAKAACWGRRPSRFADYDGFERQDLVNRLLSERNVARFIVAPSGYGKTSLAIEYAETIFSWAHTFFVNCQSPCFIRDLDDGSIADSCYKADDGARLAVFDALPPLDAYRAELFSRQIDELLAAGCEVLVTCCPSGDVLGQLQADQVRLGPFDLLLNDDELDVARAKRGQSKVPADELSAAYRVPALVWGETGGASAFLKRCFKEPMPVDCLMAMASMYVLGQGTIDDLALVGHVDLELLEHMASAYPHLCFDAEKGRFGAPLIAVDDVASALKQYVGAVVSCSAFDTRDELAIAWANILMDSLLNPGRACDVIRVLCPRPNRGGWVAARAGDLARMGCFYPSVRLVQVLSTKTSESPASVKARASTLEAISRMFLGDSAGAVTCAKRYAFDANAQRYVRAQCLVILAQLSKGALNKQAIECLDTFVPLAPFSLHAVLSPEEAFVRAWRASRVGVDALAVEWSRLRAQGASDEVLSIAASWLFAQIDELMDERMYETFASAGSNVVAAERYVRERMESLGDGVVDFATASAAWSMKNAHEKGVAYTAGPLPASVQFKLERDQASLSSQKQQFKHERRASALNRQVVLEPLSAEPRYALAEKRNVPILELTLFGRFEASIGGVRLDQRLFSRQNVRTLFALLAVNLGHELSRATLIRRMWPDSAEHYGRKSFYATWSQLKGALTLSDGSCPYLIRRQDGCSLDKHHVHTDIARLESLICELQFKERRHRDWASIYEELDADFGSDLMPVEVDNEALMQARNDYRNRLVDALVSATQSVIAAGSPEYGILFARMAVRHDAVREDAYVALMRAQVASGQTPSAVMTYHACRDALSQKLGIYPSPKTSEYFESLLS